MIAIPLEIPTTVTGVSEGDLVPLSSWPTPLEPQQDTEPFDWRTHTWALPMATATGEVISSIAVGWMVLKMGPQHLKVLSEDMAQAPPGPAATTTASDMVPTRVGVV